MVDATANAQTCLHRSIMAQSYTYEPSRDVLYLNNAKSGCSTIKSTMLTGLRQKSDPRNTDALAPTEIHGRSDFWSDDYSKITTEKTFSFSVVRNPFARVLSSFLDKMMQENLLKKHFYHQHGLAADHVLTLIEFLTLLKEGNALFDQHWRPQVANLYVGFLPLDEVHFLESLDDTQDSICSRLTGVDSFVKRSPHGTGAHKKVMEHVDAEARALIVDLYRDDFEVFGYSTDPADASASPGPVLSLPAKTPVLTDMMAHMHATHDAQDGLRQSLHALGIAPLGSDIGLDQADQWRDQVRAAADAKEPAARRYLALSIISGAARAQYGKDAVMQALFDIVQMAPYQIGNQSNLIRYLAKHGRLDEARARATTLKTMTWQKDMVQTLIDNIDTLEQGQSARAG